MLKHVSFKIEDAEGVNAVLKNAQRVTSVPVAIGNGYMSFAIEDGEPDTKERTILDHKIELGKDLILLEQCNFNDTIFVNDIGELEEHRSKKEVVEDKKEWEASLKKMEQLKALKLQNDAEIWRLKRNIELRRERIEYLKNS